MACCCILGLSTFYARVHCLKPGKWNQGLLEWRVERSGDASEQ